MIHREDNVLIGCFRMQSNRLTTTFSGKAEWARPCPSATNATSICGSPRTSNKNQLPVHFQCLALPISISEEPMGLLTK